MFERLVFLVAAAGGCLLISCTGHPADRSECLADDTLISMKSSILRLNREHAADIEQTFDQYTEDCGNGSPYDEDRISPKDCYDILQRGQSVSGIYTIRPNDYGSAFKVYCDMKTDSGGWTIFQRREDGSMDFYRYWDDYKRGFGNPGAEFWLGNDKIFRLTNQGRRYELRVDLEDFEGDTVYAKYGKFRIGDEFSDYKLVVESYNGDAGDALAFHNGQKFSTQDVDNDQYVSSCAEGYTGAWWYNECYKSNLNGQYLGDVIDTKGIVWYTWKDGYHSLKKSEMKIRPVF